MGQDKIFSLLGLAARSQHVVSGEFLTERAVKRHRAKLVLVGKDASEHTRKAFSDMCYYFHVPLYFYGTKEELGGAIGQEFRACVAVTQRGFADSLIRELDIRVGG